MQKQTMNNLNYFLFFLRDKIDNGVKQVDIAKSEVVNKSTSYVNKLYLKKPKTVPIEVQQSIAAFFNISYDRLLEEGRQVYIEQQNLQNKFPEGTATLFSNKGSNFQEKRSHEPDNLIDQLSFISHGVRKSADEKKELEEHNNNLLQIINNTGSALCVVDNELKIEYQNTLHRSLFGNSHGKNYLDSLRRDELSENLIQKLSDNEEIRLTTKQNERDFIINISSILSGNKIFKIIENITDITVNIEKQTKTIETIELYNSVFEKLEEGVTFLSNERKLVFSSNRHGLLNDFNMEGEKPNLDQVIYALSESVHDFQSIVTEIFEVHSGKKNNSSIDVHFFDGRLYHFKIEPLEDKNGEKGILIINTLLKTKK